MSSSPEIMLPREAGKWIAETSEDVKICDAGIKTLAQHVSTRIRLSTIFSPSLHTPLSYPPPTSPQFKTCESSAANK